VSINQNLYSAPLRSLLRGAPDPGQAEKKSLEKVVELRTGKFGSCLRSIVSPVQVVGPTTEKERVCIVADRSNGTTKLLWTEDRSVRRPAEEEMRGR